MPAIPGVGGAGSRPAGNPAGKTVISLLAVCSSFFLGRAGAAAEARRSAPRQSSAANRSSFSRPDPSRLLPHATEFNPGIADTAEMAQALVLQRILFRNALTGDNIPR